MVGSTTILRLPLSVTRIGDVMLQIMQTSKKKKNTEDFLLTFFFYFKNDLMSYFVLRFLLESFINNLPTLLQLVICDSVRALFP